MKPSRHLVNLDRELLFFMWSSVFTGYTEKLHYFTPQTQKYYSELEKFIAISELFIPKQKDEPPATCWRMSGKPCSYKSRPSSSFDCRPWVLLVEWHWLWPFLVGHCMRVVISQGYKHNNWNVGREETLVNTWLISVEQFCFQCVHPFRRIYSAIA